MPQPNELLETLQADVLAVLRATPALALATLLADNEGDIEARVQKALSTLTGAGGKNGLAAVVLLPEITASEENLPGPPLTVKIEIRTLENVLLNRAAATGTLLRSSQAALCILTALHLRGLGGTLLVANQNPLSAVDVKKGHVSHAIILYAQFNGTMAAKPLPVTAAMNTQGPIQIVERAGIASVSMTPGPLINGRISYSGPELRSLTLMNQGFVGAPILGWVYYRPGPDPTGNPSTASRIEAILGDIPLDQATGWHYPPGGLELGFSVTLPSALSLTCGSPTAQIRYTLDGTFPTASAALYSTPLTGLATGTTVRTAAYLPNMPPSDVLELTITA